MFYVSFDEYYGVEQYNSFLNSAKNNGVEFTEWLNIRPPHNWYVRVNPKDLPKFVDFQIANEGQERFMVKKMDPINSSDEYNLMRRESDSPANVGKFLVNDMWEYLAKKRNMVMFKNRAREYLMEVSRKPEMKDTKIFLLGKYRTWDIAVTDNKYIEGFIEQGQILHSEYDSERLEQMPYEVEAYINYYILRTDKISRKHLKTPYIMNGFYHAVKVSSKYSN
jgi:hypothetical protein